MTSAPAAAATDAAMQQQSDQPRSWGGIAVGFAGEIAALAGYRRGDLAGLRRMDPDQPDAAAFWRLMASQELLGNQETERKWGLILHGIALMTPTTSGDSDNRSAHNGRMPVGRALFLGGESRRGESGFYSETRFNRLLTARESMLRVLLARMFRMLAAADVSFSWYEMAMFIRHADYDEERAEESRRRMARDYYQAERRSSQQPEA